MKFNHAGRFKAQFHIRRELLYANAPAIIPQLGLESNIYRDFVVLRASIGRNYHIPSMNDLYWVPGGNPDLEAEDALNTEIGLDLKHPSFEHTRVFINAYQCQTSNWIRWQPAMGGIYAPDNLRKVQTRGGEININHQISFSKNQLHLSGEYSFVSSTMIETYHSNETHLLGNELMYIPNHKATFGIHFSRNNTIMVLNHAFTGSRYTDADNTQWIEGFVIADMRMEHWFTKNHSRFGLTLSIQNIYDTEYQLMPYRPMPGRWFTAGVKFIHFKNQK